MQNETLFSHMKKRFHNGSHEKPSDEDIYEISLGVIKDLGKKLYPGKITSVHDLALLQASLTYMLNLEDENGNFPAELRIEETNETVFAINSISFIAVHCYEIALEKGLKGKNILDFVNKEIRKKIDWHREVIREMQKGKFHNENQSQCS